MFCHLCGRKLDDTTGKCPVCSRNGWTPDAPAYTVPPKKSKKWLIAVIAGIVVLLPVLIVILISGSGDEKSTIRRENSDSALAASDITNSTVTDSVVPNSGTWYDEENDMTCWYNEYGELCMYDESTDILYYYDEASDFLYFYDDNGVGYYYDGYDQCFYPLSDLDSDPTPTYSGNSYDDHCYECDGRGVRACPSCNGKGYTEETKWKTDYTGTGSSSYIVETPCYRCDNGWVDCPYCN